MRPLRSKSMVRCPPREKMYSTELLPKMAQKVEQNRLKYSLPAAFVPENDFFPRTVVIVPKSLSLFPSVSGCRVFFLCFFGTLAPTGIAPPLELSERDPAARSRRLHLVVANQGACVYYSVIYTLSLVLSGTICAPVTTRKLDCQHCTVYVRRVP